MAATWWCWLAYLHTPQCQPLGVGVSIHLCGVSRWLDIKEQSRLLAPLLYLSTMCGLRTPVYKLTRSPCCLMAAWTHLPCPSTSPQWHGLASLLMCDVPLLPCSNLGMHAHTCTILQHQHMRCRHSCVVRGIGMHDLHQLCSGSSHTSCIQALAFNGTDSCVCR